MIELRLTGDPTDIMKAMHREHPELDAIHRDVGKHVIRTKREIAPYQASVLYHLAAQYGAAYALEIGTAMGYSLHFICRAMPGARKAVSLNPKMKEYHWAVKSALPFDFAQVVAMHSWDYLKICGSLQQFDFVFVDGDHEQVERDVPWFNRLRIDGLILFHDYSPAGSKRPNPHVHAVVDLMRDHLARPFDVLVVDNRNIGMAGFYRREGEMLRW